MEIITTSVHLIDYKNGNIQTIVPPEAFEEYISDLISHINDNTTVREFTTISRRTEVISSILDLFWITENGGIMFAALSHSIHFDFCSTIFKVVYTQTL